MSTKAFDTSLIAEELKQMGDDTMVFAKKLMEFTKLDLATGSISIDPKRLNMLATSSLKPELVEPVVNSFNDAASGGMAVFGSKNDISAGRGVGMPWLALSDIIYRLEGTPDLFRQALGIDKASSEMEAVEILQRNFENFPKWMAEGAIPKLFLKNPIGLPAPAPGKGDLGGGGGGGEIPGHIPQNKGHIGGFTVPELSDLTALANCFAKKTSFGPLFGWKHGYFFGFQMCLDHDCADRLAKVLIGAGGGAHVLDFLQKALSVGIKAAFKAVAFTAGIYVSIYAMALGINISEVNKIGPRGVCIQFKWPLIGLIPIPPIALPR